MRFRFVRVLALLAVLAAVFAGVAKALDFDDEDPEPPHPEIGLVYHYEIGTHAGCLPHHVVILSGELPPGLTLSQLNDHTALVSGVATEAGTFSAWLAVRDCDNKSAESLFTFDSWGRRWGIATGSLPAGATGSPYTAKITGQGLQSNVTYTVSAGALPAGLALAADGTISGTPTAVGPATFTVTGTAVSVDPSAPGTRVDSHQYTLTTSGALTATLSQRVAEVGVPVHSALAAAGGTAPYTWSAAGAEPAGIHINSDGSITGVPTRAGAYALHAHVVDANGTAKDVQVTLIVRARLAIAARAVALRAGRANRVRITVRGGVRPLRWSGRLPAGLALDGATGTIHGTPTKTGTFTVTLRVRDSLGAVASKRLLVSVR
jgi:large repetitive protein